MTDIAFDTIHDALLARGFQQTGTIRPIKYSGPLQVGSETVPVQMEFWDLDLQRLPIVRLLDRPTWIPATCNHVDARNIVCYAVNGAAFIDRYHADRQVSYCLDRAARTLEDIRHGNVLGDVNQEFAYYWHGEPIFVDAERYESKQTLAVVRLKLADREVAVLIDPQQDALKKYICYSPVKQELQSAILIPSTNTPPADGQHWPPITLEEFFKWLLAQSPELARSIRESLAGLNGLRVHRVLLVFQTDPVWFGIGFRVPPAVGQVNFRQARSFVERLEARSARLKLERYTPIRIDSDYLVRRNLREDEEPLLGKRVVLAGCGAIGGHLAHALARVGAGFSSGALFLVDPDHLGAGNLGRHRQGFEGLLLRKVDCIAAELQRSLPGINVRPVIGSVLDLHLREFDLIVDVTGEEQLSEALNARFLAGQSAPLIFSWIVGNGLAVQSFTLSSTKLGCLRCWKSHGSLACYAPAERKQTTIRIGRGCDDPFVPFNGSSPLLAAGLALQAVVDWASGNPTPTLRTIEIDYKSTRHIKPKSPKKTAICPACGANS